MGDCLSSGADLGGLIKSAKLTGNTDPVELSEIFNLGSPAFGLGTKQTNVNASRLAHELCWESNGQCGAVIE